MITAFLIPNQYGFVKGWLKEVVPSICLERKFIENPTNLDEVGTL